MVQTFKVKNKSDFYNSSIRRLRQVEFCECETNLVFKDQINFNFKITYLLLCRE